MCKYEKLVKYHLEYNYQCKSILEQINTMTKSKHNKNVFKNNYIKSRICDICDCIVVFNTNIYDITGMCGACATGESRLNYEED